MWVMDNRVTTWPVQTFCSAISNDVITCLGGDVPSKKTDISEVTGSCMCVNRLEMGTIDPIVIRSVCSAKKTRRLGFDLLIHGRA